MAVNLKKKYVTYEEFLELPDIDFAEWVDGEVLIMSPANRRHQDTVGFLYKLLSYYSELSDLGDVMLAPYNMHLAAIRRGREPDIFFVAREGSEKLRRSHLDGPADLAIEIVSPESVARARRLLYLGRERSI